MLVVFHLNRKIRKIKFIKPYFKHKPENLVSHKNFPFSHTKVKYSQVSAIVAGTRVQHSLLIKIHPYHHKLVYILRPRVCTAKFTFVYKLESFKVGFVINVSGLESSCMR